MATSQMQVVIREATAPDVEAIAALHLASWWTAYRGIVPDEFLEGITLESRVERWQAHDASTKHRVGRRTARS